MDQILLFMSHSITDVIIFIFIFQFMDDRYQRSQRNNQKKYVYFVIITAISLCLAYINLKNNFVINISFCVMAIAASACFLYKEDINKPMRRILESEAFLFSFIMCEMVGMFLYYWFLQSIHFKSYDDIIYKCIEAVFPSILYIFFYYLLIGRVTQKSDLPYSRTRYIIYVITLGYSVINILTCMYDFSQGQLNYLYLVNAICIVLVDYFLLYFVKIADGKYYYENQVKVLEQQASMQYKYYLSQEQKYNATIHILHDVDKHINGIEGLYANGKRIEAGDYVKEMKNMLEPLIPIRYTGNPILDILLTDKAVITKEKNIKFEITIDHVNLDFLDAIDATTIFGNLLDNAIEAVEKVEGEQYIRLSITPCQEMVLVRIENNALSLKWKDGLPLSDKGKDHGIGLLNVKRSIKKYDGDITLQQENGIVTVDLLLNP